MNKVIYAFLLVLFVATNSLKTYCQLITYTSGSTTGELNVSDQGAIMYTIPIKAAPGTAGLVPQLSLTYSSGGGNGLLGVGWSLQGFSKISVGRRTLAQDNSDTIQYIDGNKNNVGSKSTDVMPGLESYRYYLDGERLTLAEEPIVNGIFNKNYGKGKRAYNTEQINFSKISVTDTFASDGRPKSWEVKSKDGLTWEYGTDDNSRVKATSNSNPTAWLVRKIKDANGNYIKYNYLREAIFFPGEEFGVYDYYPSSIEYTGNEKNGLLPYNRIEFLYDYRDDQTEVINYGEGVQSVIVRRLREIHIYCEDQLIRKYVLSYIQSYLNGNSLLETVRECNVADTCFNPILFNYSDNNQINFTKNNNLKIPNPLPVAGLIYSSTSDNQLIQGDWDNNGLTDFLAFSPSSKKYQFYVHDTKKDSLYPMGHFPLDLSAFTSSTKIQIYPFDVQSDGLTDLLVVDPNTGIYSLLINRTYGPNASTVSIEFSLADTSVFILPKNILKDQRFAPVFTDWNSDGLTDIIFYNYKAYSDQPTFYFIKNKTNVDSAWIFKTEQRRLDEALPLSLGPNYTFNFSDFNNDGLPDILAWNQTTKYFKLFFKASDTGVVYNEKIINWKVTQFLGSPSSTSFLVDDFNGDGIVDVFAYDVSDGLNTIILRDYKDGNAFDVGGFNSSLIKDSKNISCFNLDGDRFSDLLITKNYDLYFIKAFSFSGYTYKLSVIDSSDNFLKNPPIIGRFSKKGPIDLFFYESQGNKSTFYNFKGTNQNVVTSITNSNHATTEIEYTDLIDGENNYQVEYFFKPYYPLRTFYPAMSVPKVVRSSDGIGGKNSTNYLFLQPFFNLEGRGFRGFGNVHIIDSLRKLKTIKRFNVLADEKTAREIHKFGGAPLFSSTIQSFENGTDKTFLRDIYSPSNKTFFRTSNFAFTSSTSNSIYEIDTTTTSNRARIPSATTYKKVNYDDYGNVLWQVIDRGEGRRDSIVNIYNNDLSRWYLGRLLKSTVYFFKPNIATIIRSTQFEYDNNTGQLIKEVLHPDSSFEYKVTKDYFYDIFGNVTKSQETAWNGYSIETRTIETIYDAKGRFALSTTNALGQTQTKEYDVRFGKPTKITSPNGITNSIRYDNLGRPVREIFPDNNWSRIRYLRSFDTSNVPQNCRYLIINESSNNPPTYNYYDELDRLIQTITIGLNGQNIVKTTTFNTKGYVSSEKEPFFKDDEASATVLNYSYDYRGRLIGATKPFKNANVTDAVSYSANQVKSTNALGQTKTNKYNGKEELVEVLDNAGNSLKFDYTATGSLDKTTDAGGNIILHTYDFRGKEISIKDPNAGTYRYTYNGFGELVKVINPKGETSSLKYDKLGRLIEREQQEGIVSFIYDTKPKGVGKLASITGLSGYAYDVSYDIYGRISKEKQTIDGKNFETAYSYNTLGKQTRIAYPGGFSVDFSYDNAGFLTRIFRAVDNYTIWNAAKINAKGQLEQYTLGNKTVVTRYIDQRGNILDSSVVTKQNGTKLQSFGYQFNSIGQLTQRSNFLLNKAETFTYDNLNRLIKSKQGSTDSVTLSYDVLGNIVEKSDVGTYTYGDLNSGPHRIKQISLKNNACIPSDNITTEFNSFDKVSKIERDSSRLEIFYNAFNQRCLQKLYVNNILVKTKSYIGGLYEYTVTGDSISEANFIRDYEGVVAVYYKNNKTGTNFQFLHKDHIGSTTLITDSLANVVAVLSYDSWGKRRKFDWSYSTDSIGNTQYERGFTGHEHYDLFDIVNMNGRIYDPVLGRFLSPDPYISDPEDLQCYNPYSYVNNDPLTITDPTGYWFGNKVARFVSGAAKFVVNAHKWVAQKAWEYRKEIVIAAIVISMGPAGATLAATMLSGALTGFATGFAGTLMSGGSVSDALKAGAIGAVVGSVTAGASYGISSAFGAIQAEGLLKMGVDVAQTGVQNGAAEMIQGGSFEHGFMEGIKQGAIQQGSMYATKGVGDIFGHKTGIDNVVQKAVAHGVVQGISAKLSGGEFRDGFITGASVSASQLLINNVNRSYRVVVSGLVGGSASALSGGKFANGAAAGMMIRMYNDDNAIKKKDDGFDNYGGNEWDATAVSQPFLLKKGQNIIYDFIKNKLKIFDEPNTKTPSPSPE